jgi:hypothetical protein
MVSPVPKCFRRMSTVSVTQFLAIRRRPDDSTRENVILTDRPFARDELTADYFHPCTFQATPRSGGMTAIRFTIFAEIFQDLA